MKRPEHLRRFLPMEDIGGIAVEKINEIIEYALATEDEMHNTRIRLQERDAKIERMRKRLRRLEIANASRLREASKKKKLRGYVKKQPGGPPTGWAVEILKTSFSPEWQRLRGGEADTGWQNREDAVRYMNYVKREAFTKPFKLRVSPLREAVTRASS